MDWITFMEKKRAELMNIGHIMDDEMFITHLLNSLPQSEYKGAILVIKDKLRKGTVEIPQIEQVLDDKYLAMKQAKGWEEEEDDYALFASPSNKKEPKKAFKGHCGYCGEFGHKAADCPNKKSNQNKGQSNVAQRANDSVMLERKKRRLSKEDPNKKSDDCNQSDAPINKLSTVNSINESMSEVQGPTDDNNKNKSRKAWTMEMLMNGGDISANTTNEEVSMSDDEKMFLYARAVHSNHLIQYHMHQIMERQRVVDKYRNMMMEGMDLIPIESNLHKFHPVIISQIINMIESDNFWHRKTFESVMSDLRNMWTEGIQELENSCTYCTNNDKKNNEMDGVEVIDLCSVSQSKNDTLSEGKESAKQESWDKSKHDRMDKMEAKLKTVKSNSTTKNDKVESAMMCWELTSDFSKEETHEEPEKVAKKPVKKTEKQKHEEEHVGPTLDTGSWLKISIEEFSWEREADASTLETEEPNQQEVVYIMNLEDGLRNSGTKLYNGKDPNEKSLLREIGLLKSPP